MSNVLQNFNNLYANLAQSSYPNNPANFPIDSLNPADRASLIVGNSVPFDFSQDTPHDGKLPHLSGHQGE